MINVSNFGKCFYTSNATKKKRLFYPYEILNHMGDIWIFEFFFWLNASFLDNNVYNNINNNNNMC